MTWARARRAESLSNGCAKPVQKSMLFFHPKSLKSILKLISAIIESWRLSMGKSAISAALISAINTLEKIKSSATGTIHIFGFMVMRYKICRHDLFSTGTKHREMIFYMRNAFTMLIQLEMSECRSYRVARIRIGNRLNTVILK